MNDKDSSLCSNIYISTAMTTLEVMREDMGLARAVETGAKIWSRLGNKLAPILKESYELSDTSLPSLTEMLNKFLNEALCFQSSITESSDTKTVITVKPCLEWTKFKENRLPPLCYRMCFSMIESLIKQLNMDINFQPGAQTRQGADRCEFILSKS